MSTILTGLRANSNLHLGNYIGAILPMVELQKNLKADDQFFMFVPDLHSFTTPIDHGRLYQNSLENIQIYLAAGIDPNLSNTYLYRQSQIPAHSELTWILSCFTYFGEMGRMIQFKEKSTKQGQSVGVGLFSYPILMAADILLYGAEYVPLGEDQKQHLELARDIAVRVNGKFADQFPMGLLKVPKTWDKQLEFSNRSESVKIRSLSNPAEKMSKSVTDPKGTILLIDSPSDAAKKVMTAQTDNEANIQWNWETQPGITNLLQLHALLSGGSLDDTKKAWVGQTRYGELKKEVAGLVEKFFSEFQENLAKISLEEVEKILEKDELEANKIANQTLYKVQQAVGLRKL